MRKKVWIAFFIIIAIAILAGVVDWPTGPDIKIGNYQKELKIHEGLDLQGGSHLVYELDTSKVDQKDRSQANQSVIDVIDRRVNSLGVSEPVIQSAKLGDKDSVIVELPGITDINQAINIIGKTAQLSFWETSANASGDLNSAASWQPTQLTGAHLRRADVTYDQTTNDPQVSLEFNADGQKLFAEITKKNLQKPVAIVLDNEIISAPIVQSEITDGKAVITGKFNITEARNLAKLLNAGALPVPVQLVEQRTIEATLGAESVKQSVFAGLIGVILIAIFMIAYYRLPGLIAIAALAIYSLIVLALFKLIPVTLTLAGIAGFILSIGMAVDANILIFERMKEELRDGKTIGASIEEGFKRAWSSIRDSNVSSLITCAILYFTTTGLVRGFAVTLAIGIIVSMFSAIIISRNFLRLISQTKLAKFIK
ncbi:MAG: protein translocase subunit SecD [Patescibacteria group bacterium]|nr:protein translocase subunit SecD [Patescibacteria group bacterium]